MIADGSAGSFSGAYSFAAADTIRVLVATDCHVGFEERDPIRKDDSWKSFHEIMCLGKSEDVCDPCTVCRILSDCIRSI